MSSIFTKIIRREIPAYIVAEDENHIAFLDMNPTAKGHTLVVPKQEVDQLFDLEDQTYSALWRFAQMVANNLKKAIPCKRIGVAVVGLEVPHTHIHLIPIHELEDMNFSKKRLEYSPEEYKTILQNIINASITED